MSEKSDQAKAHSGAVSSVKRNVSRVLKLSVQTVTVLIGVRVGIGILKRTGRFLFGGSKDKAQSIVEQQPNAAQAAEVPAVPPATHWRPVDVPSPVVPSDYKTIHSMTLPCSVYTFYCNILSQQSDWLQRQHETIDRQYNFVKRAWYPTPVNLSQYPDADDQSMLQAQNRTVFDFVLGAGSSGGFMRTITFITPPKPPNTADAKCVQRQQFMVYSDGALMMATSMNMLNIPFKECFMVNTAWKVVPAEDNSRSCTLTLSAKVHFLKGVLVGGIIRAATFRDLTSFYKTVMSNMVTHLATVPHVPDPTGSGVNSSWLSRSTTARCATGGPVARGLPPTAGQTQQQQQQQQQQMLAHSVPIGRQLRVLVIMCVLLGSLLHQALLHKELRVLLASLGKDSSLGWL